MNITYEGHEATALYNFLRKEETIPGSIVSEGLHKTEHWKLRLYGHRKYPYGWYTATFKNGQLVKITGPLNANDINSAAPLHMNVD